MLDLLLVMLPQSDARRARGGIPAASTKGTTRAGSSHGSEALDARGQPTESRRSSPRPNFYRVTASWEAPRGLSLWASVSDCLVPPRWRSC